MQRNSAIVKIVMNSNKEDIYKPLHCWKATLTNITIFYHKVCEDSFIPSVKWKEVLMERVNKRNYIN